jgi:signal transduction histidine kinase
MALELAQVAAGLPMVLSLALAGGITTFREGRRRSALNEAMHELRRPLQSLSLAVSVDSVRPGALESSLSMAVAALERLDREINGLAEAGTRHPVELEPLLRMAAERWRSRAGREGRGLRLRCAASRLVVCGGAVDVAFALDNLISNAIEHGQGEVTVEAREVEGYASVAVVDEGLSSVGDEGSRPSLRMRLGGRCRHGHGLRVVRQVARAHGGSFRLRRSSTGTEARLELPLHRPEGAG